MERPRTRITFKRNMEVELEGFGFEGSGCTQAAKPYIDTLGVAGEQRMKAEWYLKNSQNLREEAQMGVDGTKLCG